MPRGPIVAVTAVAFAAAFPIAVTAVIAVIAVTTVTVVVAVVGVALRMSLPSPCGSLSGGWPASRLGKICYISKTQLWAGWARRSALRPGPEGVMLRRGDFTE